MARPCFIIKEGDFSSGTPGNKGGFASELFLKQLHLVVKSSRLFLNTYVCADVQLKPYIYAHKHPQTSFLSLCLSTYM